MPELDDEVAFNKRALGHDGTYRQRTISMRWNPAVDERAYLVRDGANSMTWRFPSANPVTHMLFLSIPPNACSADKAGRRPPQPF